MTEPEELPPGFPNKRQEAKKAAKAAEKAADPGASA